MVSSTLSTSALQSRPVTVASETVRRGEVVTAEHRVWWLRRPVGHNTGWAGALLRIDGQVYRADCFFTPDGDTGHVWQVIDLRGRGQKHYRLTIGPDGINCDCPHSVYRGCGCKHAASVAEALDQLQAMERAEWAADVAAADLEAVSIPF